jgi:hypothetical protein
MKRWWKSRDILWGLSGWETYGNVGSWTSRVHTFSGKDARRKCNQAVRRWTSYECCIGYSQREGTDLNHKNETVIEVKWHCESSASYHAWVVKGKPRKR